MTMLTGAIGIGEAGVYALLGYGMVCAGRGRACIFYPDSAPIQPSALSKRKHKEMLPRPFLQGKGASIILGPSLSWGQIVIT